MMSLAAEFKKFLFRGNVVDLAVAVVIGAAFGKIVSAFVDDLVMPLVSPFLPGGAWREATVTSLNIKIGHLLGTLLDFMIVAAVIFFLLVKFVGALQRAKAPSAPVPPSTKNCPECMEAVPAPARRCKFCTSVLAAIAILLMGAPAFAQPAPKFEYAEAPKGEKPHVEWAAQVKGGVLLTSGNAQSTSAILNANVSRRGGDNRFALDTLAAYGESRNRFFNPALGGDPTLVENDAEIDRRSVPTANTLQARARYDRFLTLRNSAYVLASAARDKLAGKKLLAGGQVGYSRLLLTNEAHEIVGEVGYDFSYESFYSAQAEGITVHSARLFLGEVWKLSDDTGIYGNAEVLFNLNRETNALDARVKYSPRGPDDMPLRDAITGMPLPFANNGVGPFKDTRVTGKAGLTTKLGKNLSFGFGLTVRYDQNPALLPTKFAPTYRAFANTLDVIADASLIVSLL